MQFSFQEFPLLFTHAVCCVVNSSEAATAPHRNGDIQGEGKGKSLSRKNPINILRVAKENQKQPQLYTIHYHDTESSPRLLRIYYSGSS